MKRNRKLPLIAAAVLIVLGALWFQFGGHRTAQGQLPLADLNAQSMDQLRADFNAAAGETRMILLLSPT